MPVANAAPARPYEILLWQVTPCNPWQRRLLRPPLLAGARFIVQGSCQTHCLVGNTTYVFLAICGVHTFGFTTRVQKFAELRHVIWRIPHDPVRPLSLTMREVERLMVPAYRPHQVPQQSWLGYDNTPGMVMNIVIANAERKRLLKWRVRIPLCVCDFKLT